MMVRKCLYPVSQSSVRMAGGGYRPASVDPDEEIVSNVVPSRVIELKHKSGEDAYDSRIEAFMSRYGSDWKNHNQALGTRSGRVVVVGGNQGSDLETKSD